MRRLRWAFAVLLLGLLLVWPAPPSHAGERRHLLWVAAHPDDELLVAPILASRCIRQAEDCTLLVLTRGEAGPCLLPGGCRPSLSAVRHRELRQSAALLHARLEQWALPDGGGIDGRWDLVAGGHDELVDRLRNAIESFHPDRLLTFDPRHGTTCHVDHRRVGALVLEALESMPSRPRVELLETLASTTSQPFTATFVPAATPPAAGITRFDPKPALWTFVGRVAAIHRSQFPSDAPGFLNHVSWEQRSVFTAPAAAAMASSQIHGCP